MAERVLEEFLDVLPLNLEEKRALKIILGSGPIDAKEAKVLYERGFAKIGTKIYHVLNSLKDKGYVNREGKAYSCNKEKIAADIRNILKVEDEKIHKLMEKMDLIDKPSLTTHIGTDSVADLFSKIAAKLEQGCELHVIKDTIHYPLRPDEPLNKKAFIKGDRKIMGLMYKNRKAGKTKEYYIVEKEKSEKAIRNLAKKLGKDYVKESLKQMIELLDLDNFNIVFGNNLEFKFFVIPGYCAVTTWLSSPKQFILDRAIVFWYPDDIKGLDDYFWNEWRNLAGGKEEVKKWAVDLMNKL